VSISNSISRWVGHSAVDIFPLVPRPTVSFIGVPQVKEIDLIAYRFAADLLLVYSRQARVDKQLDLSLGRSFCCRCVSSCAEAIFSFIEAPRVKEVDPIAYLFATDLLFVYLVQARTDMGNGAYSHIKNVASREYKSHRGCSIPGGNLQAVMGIAALMVRSSMSWDSEGTLLVRAAHRRALKWLWKM
jgi:hypothetical protein